MYHGDLNTLKKLALDDYNAALEEVFADMNGKFNGIRSVNVTAYQDIFEQIKAASPKNGEAASSMQKNSVESFGDGKQYVKADRQVIFGNDMIRGVPSSKTISTGKSAADRT